MNAYARLSIGLMRRLALREHTAAAFSSKLCTNGCGSSALPPACRRRYMPVAEHGGAVGERIERVAVVRHHEHREAVATQPLIAARSAGAVRIEAPRRLVEDQQVGREGKRAQARRASPFRPKVRRQQRPLVRRELHFRELRMHDRADLLLRNAAALAQRKATLSNTVSGKKRPVLEQHPHAAPRVAPS